MMTVAMILKRCETVAWSLVHDVASHVLDIISHPDTSQKQHSHLFCYINCSLSYSIVFGESQWAQRFWEAGTPD